MIRTAALSRDRRYRYRLGRQWGAGPLLPWLLLNPSSADEAGEDPTIRRVISFSASWGYGGCSVVNLLGFRSADPAVLTNVEDPAGPGNERAIRAAIEDAAASGADHIVVGWGVRGQQLLGSTLPAGVRARRVAAIVTDQGRRAGLDVVSLGVTRRGAPRHPLYVRASTRPRPLVDGAITTTNRTRPARARATPR